MDDERTRHELLAENEAMYAELEDMAERIGELLDDDADEEVPDDDGSDDAVA